MLFRGFFGAVVRGVTGYWVALAGRLGALLTEATTCMGQATWFCGPAQFGENVVLILSEAEEADPAEVDDARLDAADAVGRQMLRLLKLVHRVNMHALANDEDGMETAAYRLLAQLATEGPARTTVLAEAVHTDASTVSRQTTALVKAGLLERTPDPADGRACVLAATPEGIRVFEHNRRNRDTHIAQMLAGWGADDLAQLVELLDKFNTDFEIYRPVLLGLGKKNVSPRADTDAHTGDLHEGEKNR